MQREFYSQFAECSYKYYANIRNLNHKAQDATMKSAVFIENVLIKEETKNDI